MGLPNDGIIHCHGPVYGRDEPSDELPADCYRNALRIAESEGVKSAVFPAISTGAFRYPVEEAAEVALRTEMQKAEELTEVGRIGFVLYSDESLKVHKSKAERLSGTIT